jgi:hypothetical protein
MFRVLAAILLLGSGPLALASANLLIEMDGLAALPMSAGNSYSFSFASLNAVSWTSVSFLTPQTANSSGFFVRSYTEVDPLQSPPDAWTIRMYQGPSAVDTNLFAVLRNTESYVTTHPYSWSLMNGQSADMGGMLQINMDSGSARISEVGVNVVKDGTQYQKVFTFAVPEPSSTSLMALGLGALAWGRRRKK